MYLHQMRPVLMPVRAPVVPQMRGHVLPAQPGPAQTPRQLGGFLDFWSALAVGSDILKI